MIFPQPMPKCGHIVSMLALFNKERSIAKTNLSRSSGLWSLSQIFFGQKRKSRKAKVVAGDPGRASSSDRTYGSRESPLGSKAHPGRIGKVRVSGFRQDRGQIYARVSPPRPDRDMARVPDAACIEHVGLRLFLGPGGPVPNASRLLRGSARQQRNPPRRSDAASNSGLGSPANRGMLRLGPGATAIFDSRSG